jgi:uncharacterized protein involved in propanediol utilization
MRSPFVPLAQKVIIPPVSLGIGWAPAHFGELLQGQIVHAAAEGQIVNRRCLVSLPCYAMQSTARFTPKVDSNLSVVPAAKRKAKTAARLALDYLGARHFGGDLVIQSTIPEGKGGGSSTSDCVATIRAVFGAFCTTLDEAILARITVCAEKASDSTMFDRAVLFAGREGEIVEDYGCPLPVMAAVGVDTDETGRIDTLEYRPAEYTDRERRRFGELIAELGRAIRSTDLHSLGYIATESAAINQRYLPNPFFLELTRICEHCEGLGVAVAHSGTLACILFDPHGSGLEAKSDRIRGWLERMGLSNSLAFDTCQRPIHMPVQHNLSSAAASLDRSGIFRPDSSYP